DGSASDELKASFPQVSALVCCAKCSFVPKAKPDSCKITFPALSGFCCSSFFFFFISRISLSIFYNQKDIRNRVHASINNIDVATPSHPDADPEATIVQLSFGDRLGALIDTMRALKDLGLDVIKGSVSTEGSVKQTKFSITKLDTGRKVEDPDSLEQIRLTIINNLLKYHPECSDQLAMGETFGIKAPQKKIDVDIATHIHVKEDGPKRRYLLSGITTPLRSLQKEREREIYRIKLILQVFFVCSKTKTALSPFRNRICCGLSSLPLLNIMWKLVIPSSRLRYFFCLELNHIGG
ncbi:unnamed protein product, partial [Brassica oleracea]